MLNIDYDGDFSDFNPLREEVINAVEQLSEKDRICIDAIYSEQITYEELGERLGYSPQPNGSPQAYFATKRALERLKKILLRSPIIAEYVAGLPDASQ
jgi:DNA-directed RNA polymerase specialized sigma subunit